MSDRTKTILAVLFFIGALTLPIVGLVVGWWKWNPQTGIFIMAGTFLIMFVIGGLLLMKVKDLSWLTVSLPYIFGASYSLLPDLIPFSVDDAAATTAGALFSFALALRKKSDTPKWVFLPLVAAGIYAFFGGYIPGPVDELLVDVLAIIIAGVGVSQGGGESESRRISESTN